MCLREQSHGTHSKITKTRQTQKPETQKHAGRRETTSKSITNKQTPSAVVSEVSFRKGFLQHVVPETRENPALNLNTMFSQFFKKQQNTGVLMEHVNNDHRGAGDHPSELSLPLKMEDRRSRPLVADPRAGTHFKNTLMTIIII